MEQQLKGTESGLTKVELKNMREQVDIIQQSKASVFGETMSSVQKKKFISTNKPSLVERTKESGRYITHYRECKNVIRTKGLGLCFLMTPCLSTDIWCHAMPILFLNFQTTRSDIRRHLLKKLDDRIF